MNINDRVQVNTKIAGSLFNKAIGSIKEIAYDIKSFQVEIESMKEDNEVAAQIMHRPVEQRRFWFYETEIKPIK